MVVTSWFKKFAQAAYDQFLNDLRSRWTAAQQESRRLRESFPRTPANTYYEQVVQDVQRDEAAKEPWRRLLDWVQTANPEMLSQITSEIEYLRQLASPDTAPSQEEVETNITDEMAEWYLDGNQVNDLLRLYQSRGLRYQIYTAPTGKKILTLPVGDELWVVSHASNGQGVNYWKSPEDWLDHAEQYSFEYIPEVNRSESFWSDPPAYLYHATQPENLESIMQQGLTARSDTRGLYNNDIGDAVFTVSDENYDDLTGVIGSYGSVIIRIDVGAMKRDGYTPPVQGETPLEEAQIKSQLAAIIDYEYHNDVADDYIDDTIAILGNIPPKYLSVVS